MSIYQAMNLRNLSSLDTHILLNSLELVFKESRLLMDPVALLLNGLHLLPDLLGLI